MKGNPEEPQRELELEASDDEAAEEDPEDEVPGAQEGACSGGPFCSFLVIFFLAVRLHSDGSKAAQRVSTCQHPLTDFDRLTTVRIQPGGHILQNFRSFRGLAFLGSGAQRRPKAKAENARQHLCLAPRQLSV